MKIYLIFVFLILIYLKVCLSSSILDKEKYINKLIRKYDILSDIGK
jgi:hypothetical protein